MAEDKLPTMNLMGKEYVQVKDRVLYFNEKFEKGSIITDYKPTSKGIIFKATVYPDGIGMVSRSFTGHSYGTVIDEKAMEKLETVAVGRALAFMGIGVLEGVASADEMADVKTYKPVPPSPRPVTTTKYSNEEPKEVPDEKTMPPCPTCGGSFKLIPAGISKKSKKPYSAFYACQTKGCDTTVDMDRAQDLVDTEFKKKEAIFTTPEVPVPPDYGDVDNDLPF